MSTKPCPQCQRFVANTAQFCAFCGYAYASSGGLTGQLAANGMLDNRYLIVELVGQGGMGAVYRALDTRLQGRVCAIKEMSVNALPPSERPQAVRQFEQEAALLSKLRHPHLPQVHDFFKDDSGRFYLAMDFVEGETLGQRLVRQGRPFSESEARLYAEQLCDVLAYLHEQDPPIIFRDLKPDNIMLDKNDEIKLIDFGIARLFKPMQTQDTQVFGTPGYAAPEQYGHGQTDARTDIYGLGVTLLTLVTGHDPGVDPFRLPNAQRLNSAISGQMAAVIQRATQLQVGNRFQSAREFRQALQPTGALAAFSWNKAANGNQVWRAVGAAAAALAAIVLFGFLVASGLGMRTEASALALTQTAEINQTPMIIEAVVFVTVTVVGDAAADTPTITPDAPANAPIPLTETVTPSATPSVTASPTPTPPLTPIPPAAVPRIVFQSSRNGKFEIYSINIRGEDLQRLTNNNWNDQYPAVSPDGRQIAFQSDRDGNWEIYVMDIDGRDQQRLTNHRAADRLPAWSPDGQHITFSADRSGAFEIYTMRADGGDVRQVTSNGTRSGHAVWSAQNRLAFNNGGSSSRTWHIMTVDLDGRNSQTLTQNGNWSPEWSPDGDSILFISSRIGGDANPAIFVMDSDGRNQRVVYDSSDYEWGARWSEDGQTIIFTRDRGGQDSIYMIPISGGSPTLITSNGSYPSWVNGR